MINQGLFPEKIPFLLKGGWVLQARPRSFWEYPALLPSTGMLKAVPILNKNSKFLPSSKGLLMILKLCNPSYSRKTNPNSTWLLLSLLPNDDQVHGTELAVFKRVQPSQVFLAIRCCINTIAVRTTNTTCLQTQLFNKRERTIVITLCSV